MTQGEFVSWERPQLAYVLHMQVRAAAIMVVFVVAAAVSVMVVVSVAATKTAATNVTRMDRQWMFTSFVMCNGSCGQQVTPSFIQTCKNAGHDVCAFVTLQQKQLFYCCAHFDKACCTCTMER
jgi:uncharacterized membrane protein YgcG